MRALPGGAAASAVESAAPHSSLWPVHAEPKRQGPGLLRSRTGRPRTPMPMSSTLTELGDLPRRHAAA